MELLVSALQSMLLVPLTLLPVINPLSGAPVVLTIVGNNDRAIRQLSRQVAINAWFVIVASMLVGTYVLQLFGISLPIVRIGGGLLVAASGWRMLNSVQHDNVQEAVARGNTAELDADEIMRRSFFPLTFPLTTGPGTIAAAIALGAKLPNQPTLYALGAVIDVIGAALTAAAVYLLYRNAGRLLARLGEIGGMVMNKLMAFILLCIGIQIIWTGWAELNHLA